MSPEHPLAASTNAESLGQAVVAKANSYKGGNYTIGPWKENWCGDFVRYVWTQEGVAEASWMTALVTDWKKAPGYHPIGSGYVPQPGDAVVYADKSYPDGSHIAIVTNYSNGLLSDIGGDEGGTTDGPYWATSHVGVDEDGGQAFDPTKHLFVGTTAEMWVIGYVSLPGGTPPAPPSVSPPSGIANGGSYHGTVPLTGTSTQAATAFYVHLQQDGVDKFVSHPAIPGGTSFSYQLDTTVVPDGTYQALTGAVINGTAYYSPPISITLENLLASTSDSTWSVYNPDTKMTTTFGVGTNGVIGFSIGNGTTWPDWAPVSGNWGPFPVTVKPTGIYNPDSKEMMVFARQSDGRLGMSQYPDQGNAWFSAWAELNNYWKLGGEPSVVYNPGTKTMTVFARGNDGNLGFTQSVNGGQWTQWAIVNTYWGAKFAGDPHAIYNPDTKQVSVFARANDGTIGISTYVPGATWPWSNWTPVNTFWKNGGDPSVVYNPGTKTMTVFARGNDGNLGFTQSVNGGQWTQWAIVNTYWGAKFVGTPHAIYNPDTKQVSVFARDNSGAVGVSTYVPGAAWPWSNWTVLNGWWNLTGDPAVTYNPSTKTTTAFAMGAINHLGVTASVNGGQWSQWNDANTFWNLAGPTAD